MTFRVETTDFYVWTVRTSSGSLVGHIVEMPNGKLATVDSQATVCVTELYGRTEVNDCAAEMYAEWALMEGN